MVENFVPFSIQNISSLLSIFVNNSLLQIWLKLKLKCIVQKRYPVPIVRIIKLLEKFSIFLYFAKNGRRFIKNTYASCPAHLFYSFYALKCNLDDRYFFVMSLETF